jgi:RimJ/RimL family protein N-acetyltransferase
VDSRNSDPVIRLSKLDPATAGQLVAAAVAGAAPAEVMPHTGGPDWTADAQAAYHGFLEAQLADEDTATYTVGMGDAIVGVIRLTRRDAITAETGMWLCRHARGRGLGTAALRAVLVAARGLGYRVVVAETTADNAAALGVLAACGAATSDPECPNGASVSAEMAVPMGSVLEAGDVRVLAYAEDAPVLAQVGDVLDTVIAPTFGAPVSWVALPVGRLAPEFFTLSTRLAGEMLQKLINYRLNVAIVGDLSAHLERSPALRDFVRESNRGRQVWFVATLAELTQRLS